MACYTNKKSRSGSYTDRSKHSYVGLDAVMHPLPEWKEYELAVRDELAASLPDATVLADVRLPGIRSQTERQIDVLIEERLSGHLVRTAVDAKLYSRPLDVKDVEDFIGMLGDIEVERGLLVTKTGYTKAAMARAFADSVDLDLDILSLEEFKQWQGRAALPFSGPHVVALFAPFGWAIDARTVPQSYLARLYRRGLSAKQAEDRWEWMYLNIWTRHHPVNSLDALIAQQSAYLLSASSNRAIITQREVDLRVSERTVVRRAEMPQYRTAEITGFVEFRDFICFVVLFTPLHLERRNTRKLEYLLRKMTPGTVVKPT
ncbi:MAG: hypothetical protein HOO98_07015 [Nitrospira sp.]|nr:hypothetical protein [Nitrospira sp.]